MPAAALSWPRSMPAASFGRVQFRLPPSPCPLPLSPVRVGCPLPPSLDRVECPLPPSPGRAQCLPPLSPGHARSLLPPSLDRARCPLLLTPGPSPCWLRPFLGRAEFQLPPFLVPSRSLRRLYRWPGRVSRRLCPGGQTPCRPRIAGGRRSSWIFARCAGSIGACASPAAACALASARAEEMPSATSGITPVGTMGEAPPSTSVRNDAHRVEVPGMFS